MFRLVQNCKSLEGNDTQRFKAFKELMRKGRQKTKTLLSPLNSLNSLNIRRDWQFSHRKGVPDVQRKTLNGIKYSMTDTLRQIVANVGNSKSKDN